MMVSQLFWNSPDEPPPKANTAITIRAAMPAIRRPYSTAEAPRSRRRRWVPKRPKPRLRVETRSQSSWVFMPSSAILGSGAGAGVGGAGGDGLAGVLEDRGQVVAEGEDDDD